MKAQDEATFCAVATARAPALRRTAYVLCGDWHHAEDLVQQALVKAYVAWPLRDEGAAAAFLQRTLLHTWIDSTRRGWWRFERSTDEVPDVRTTEDDLAHDRPALVEALRRIPTRQRACVVLRYLEDLSVEDTASLLGCSTGTVKSQTSRGLEALRRELGPAASPDLLTTTGDMR